MWGILTFILYELDNYNKNNIIKENLAICLKGPRKRTLQECLRQKNKKLSATIENFQ